MTTPGKSIRQQIMEAYEDQLQTITTGAVYNTSLGSYIYEDKDTPFADTATLGLVYRDTNNTTAQTFGNQEHMLTVENLILVVGTAAKKRQVIADFVKCIGSNLTLGGLCEEISPISDEAVEGDHANKKAYWITIRIAIQYITSNWNPYS